MATLSANVIFFIWQILLQKIFFYSLIEKLEIRSENKVLYNLEYWTDYNHYFNYLKKEV